MKRNWRKFVLKRNVVTSWYHQTVFKIYTFIFVRTVFYQIALSDWLTSGPYETVQTARVLNRILNRFCCFKPTKRKRRSYLPFWSVRNIFCHRSQKCPSACGLHFLDLGQIYFYIRTYKPINDIHVCNLKVVGKNNFYNL